jgi:hypothetical protein
MIELAELMPTLSRQRSRRIQNHASDDRIRRAESDSVARQFQRPAHPARILFRVGEDLSHGLPSSTAASEFVGQELAVDCKESERHCAVISAYCKMSGTIPRIRMPNARWKLFGNLRFGSAVQ